MTPSATSRSWLRLRRGREPTRFAFRSGTPSTRITSPSKITRSTTAWASSSTTTKLPPSKVLSMPLELDKCVKWRVTQNKAVPRDMWRHWADPVMGMPCRCSTGATFERIQSSRVSVSVLRSFAAFHGSGDATVSIAEFFGFSLF
ncbi:hypothetical protein PIB30_065035 [Stylosanthes scabra]|uniref:Uncharacterized protein n=1 Tax=Stylosanthes scabra TaxID=79078 RepID=A0ABU6RLS9_9FABA|nr:hypothetical protein [Stylosanthes scabra]